MKANGLTVGIIVSLITGIFVFSFACRQNKAMVSAPETVSYNFHIRPILSDKCFACHGPDAKKRKANFRLDIKDSAYAPLKETKGAFAIVPGKPEESEIFKRVSSV